MGRKEHSFPLRSFTPVKIFPGWSSLGTSKTFPVRVTLLTAFSQGYLGGVRPASPSPCGNFLDLFRIFGRSVSVCSPSSSSPCILFLLTVQPSSFPCSWIICAIVIVSGWLSGIRSVNCNVSFTLCSGQLNHYIPNLCW